MYRYLPLAILYKILARYADRYADIFVEFLYSQYQLCKALVDILPLSLAEMYKNLTILIYSEIVKDDASVTPMFT